MYYNTVLCFTNPLALPSSSLVDNTKNDDFYSGVVIFIIVAVVSLALILVVIIFIAFVCWCIFSTKQKQDDFEFEASSGLVGPRSLTRRTISHNMQRIRVLGQGRYGQVWLCEY